MPVVFIHGVYTRKTEEYQQLVELRRKLIESLLLAPLGDPYASLIVKECYWGEFGVKPELVMELFPPASGEQSLGPEKNLDLMPGESYDLVRNMDPSATPAQLAIDALLSELLDEESEYLNRPELVAQIAMAACDLSSAKLSQEKQELGQASNPDDMKALVHKVHDEILDLVEQRQHIPESSAGEQMMGAFSLPDVELMLRKALVSVQEGYEQVKTRTTRTLSAPVIRRLRQLYGMKAFMFLGDAFKYFGQRGSPENPGDIIKEVLGKIGVHPSNQFLHLEEGALQHQPDREPLIVITHSMGGNIFYDILVNFCPTLEVDAWVSVAGQVAWFERVEAFGPGGLGGQPGDKLGNRVKCWLNVYDPIDPVAFKAEPVFKDRVQDFPFHTGVGGMESHGHYFYLKRFYERLGTRLKSCLLPKDGDELA